MTIKSIPDGYHSVTPYLSIKGAAEAIEFYKRAFSATELFRLVAPNGEIGHAEIKIGDSPIMLADPYEEGAFRNPRSLGGSSVGLHVYVEDVDALFVQAVDAGAKIWRYAVVAIGYGFNSHAFSPFQVRLPSRSSSYHNENKS